MRGLPGGWYPETATGIDELLAAWEAESESPPRTALAAVAPHAGWAFSGRLAALSLRSLAPAETVAVIGGHLPPGYPILMATEDGFETPLGPVFRDLEFSSRLGEAVRLEPDKVPDNTVEIQLPLVKAIFPQARVLWLRAPADAQATELGLALARVASELGREVVCLGSTDLTHYGPDYGFEPAGGGEKAAAWVREVSDQAFIDALLELDATAALARGNEGSACSSGGAVAALSFAKARGAVKARLLAHTTSLEVRKAASFVGYASVAFLKA
jgi:AmmeMemoRadiSam system protein B